MRIAQFHGDLCDFERVYLLGASTINDGLDAKLFTYDGLGLENGDRLLDQVLRELFVYRDGKLVRVARSGEAPPVSR